MKKTARILGIALVAALSLSLFAGCGQGTGTSNTTSGNAKSTASASPSGSGTKNYVIYSDNSFAPFEYLDNKTNKYTGIDMDIMTAIAADQHLTYSINNAGFDAAMGAVQSGQADGMIAGMTITDDRAKTFDFSDGYFTDGQILVVSSNSKITKLDDLKGKSVAAKTSTQGAKYAASIADQYGFTVQYYEDSPTMYTAVINGTNDACFEDYSVVNYAIKSSNLGLKTVGDVINPGKYGFAVKKGTNADLIKKFNAGLADIKSNGKLDEILKNYGITASK